MDAVPQSQSQCHIVDHGHELRIRYLLMLNFDSCINAIEANSYVRRPVCKEGVALAGVEKNQPALGECSSLGGAAGASGVWTITRSTTALQLGQRGRIFEVCRL